MDVAVTSRGYWSAAGTAVVLTTVAFLIWNAWDRPAAETDNEDALRIRALETIAGKLNDTHQWRTSFSNGPEFDRWLAEIRNEFRPYFSVLSVEFDSRLIFILREFEAYADNSGPLLDHSRQLALVSTRGLIEEERDRLEYSSAHTNAIDNQPAKTMRLPHSMLMDGWYN